MFMLNFDVCRMNLSLISVDDKCTHKEYLCQEKRETWAKLFTHKNAFIKCIFKVEINVSFFGLCPSQRAFLHLSLRLVLFFRFCLFRFLYLLSFFLPSTLHLSHRTTQASESVFASIFQYFCLLYFCVYLSVLFSSFLFSFWAADPKGTMSYRTWENFRWSERANECTSVPGHSPPRTWNRTLTPQGPSPLHPFLRGTRIYFNS